jgi:hypothetical protein
VCIRESLLRLFLSLSPPANLKYLAVNQALDDMAYFMANFANVSGVRGIRDAPLRWFVFGGSYSGALSAWFRVKVRATTVSMRSYCPASRCLAS